MFIGGLTGTPRQARLTTILPGLRYEFHTGSSLLGGFRLSTPFRPEKYTKRRVIDHAATGGPDAVADMEPEGELNRSVVTY